MADLMENPPSRREAAAPEVVPSSALPQVTDGIVYLPAGQPVKPDSTEFESLLRKNLPPEILPDVMTNWRGISARTNCLQLLAAVFALLASAVSLYYFFPPTVHEDLVSHGGLEIQNPFSASPFRSLYREACRSYEQGDYHSVCRILKPEVEEIIRKKDRDSYSLVFLYFQTMGKIHNRTGNPYAAMRLGELMQQDPDTPAWAQFHFELSPRIQSAIDYEQVSRSLSQDAAFRSRLKLYLHDNDIALKHLDNLRRITNPGKFSASELKKYQEDYDLFEIKLLLSRWLLKGCSAGTPTLPDNEYDPGVFEREKALRLAMKHQDSACEDFWRARLFIAKKLIAQDSFLNHIYWNGLYHTSLDALKLEIQKCEQRLKER